MVLRSHVLAGLAFGPYTTSELALAEPLWQQLPDASLTVVDREFATYEIFHGRAPLDLAHQGQAEGISRRRRERVAGSGHSASSGGVAPDGAGSTPHAIGTSPIGSYEQYSPI